MQAVATEDAKERLREKRDMMETIIALSEHLNPSDRALIQSVYDRGVTATDLARATGQSPRRIRERTRRLMQHVTSPMFRHVVRNRNDWPEQRRNVATAIFLERMTQRQAAAKLELTIHRVRQEIDRVRFSLPSSQE